MQINLQISELSDMTDIIGVRNIIGFSKGQVYTSLNLQQLSFTAYSYLFTQTNTPRFVRGNDVLVIKFTSHVPTILRGTYIYSIPQCTHRVTHQYGSTPVIVISH
jgi:hypothetical protein